jgi:hypothetical protein
MTLPMSQANQPEQLTFLQQASPVKTSVWPENEQDWKALEAACSGKFAEFYENSLRPGSLLSGLFSKTSPACFLRVKDATLPSCSTPWMNSGMVWRGVCLTRSFSESPNVAEECSLSDVLESHVPRRFFLSPRAAAGILRRAEKRGRTLPSRLQAALESLATRQGDGTKMTITSFQASWEAEPACKELQALNPSRDIASFSKPSLPSGPKDQADQREMSTTISPCVELSEIGADQAQKKLDQIGLSVRRLTPTECETLQAFPKGWTVPSPQEWTQRGTGRSETP